MRILHVTDTYLPVVGGIEMMVGELAERQLAAGHDVTVVTRVSGEAPGPVPTVRTSHVPPSLVRAADQVHAHVSVWSPLAWEGLRTSARADVPALATVHSSWAGMEPLLRGLARVGGWADPRVQWAAVSRCAAEPVRRTLRPQSGVLVVPNAVDPTAWTPGPLRPLEPARLVVASTLRMARRKRPFALVDLLADIHRRLRSQGVELQAVLVGDGPLLDRVRARARRLGLEDAIDLPGRLAHPELRAVLEVADAYVAPADLETFGLAALEARCAGLVVVGKRRTGVADLVEPGMTGLLADDDAGLADHLVALGSDPELRGRLRARVRSTDPGFGWSQVLARHEAAYATSARLASVARPAGRRVLVLP